MNGEGNGGSRSLTREQIVASASRERAVFIEAAPGSGKTTVAAQRFGAQRFTPPSLSDHRAVVAVSFTRAATWELRQRVLRFWGPRAIAWPHRIVTLDTVMYDLLIDLLATGLIEWPGGHCELRVEDSWKVVASTAWRRDRYRIDLVDSKVTVAIEWLPDSGPHIPPAVVKDYVESGMCTHEDVRTVLELALEREDVRDRVKARIAASMRALIVDEVFDANDLDLAIIELALETDVYISLIGDPWQALYVFRGAKPEAVPELVERTGMTPLPLTKSFRWRDPAQRALAADLRNGVGVTLDRVGDGGASAGADVVLALTWKQLWDAGAHVLPLAFSSPKGGTEEAAATLLLNHVSQLNLGENATYLSDALTTLGISDIDTPRHLEGGLQLVLETLLEGGKDGTNAAYGKLVAVVKTVSPRTLRKAHHSHTGRLALIAERVARTDKPVLGLTTHQAKGREWDVVGVRLTPEERGALAAGLKVTRDTDRKLYVACTRARFRTVEVAHGLE